MRNLKKILALALALVMSMSLMATANAFTDDDSITDTYDTAVTVLSELQVFQGYDDGSFLPQGAITRAEVAAIIYRIVTGDVADTQVGIYVDYNKFDDVASTSWYAGYVNFCANAEYIKGYDARTFGPNDPVTGYQALAMILRALGYDKNGEFTGTNWQVQTAAVGESRGITKNITAGTLGVPATREVVAEILFQAILVNTVTYMPAFGYREDETSLGWETFGLEYVTGVVTANEYADLYDTEPLDEGETRLDVDGTDYDIAYSTTLEEMGMAYNVYLANGGQVLAIADAGNTVFETGEGTEIDEDNTGMDVDSAQKFLNFDEDTVYTSDWRIEYVLVFDNPADAAQFAADYDDNGSGSESYTNGSDRVSVVFRRNSDISAYDMARIDDIFSIASRTDADDDATIIDGEVYVGTQAIDDISDDVSYRQFMADYIDTEDNDAAYTASDNGEWLKVIDNDGDGVADYIFLTEFAMAQIDDISRDDEYTLSALEDVTARNTDNDVEIEPEDEIAVGDIVTEDELAEGDVVLYTFIDGKYYIDLAEVVTGTVDARGINSHTETMTVDGTDYVQSHIGYSTADQYYHDVTQGHTEETYDLYLDHFGYVRLFIESDYNTFMLLTDGWYEDDRRVETFQAMFWNVEAEEEELIDIADGGSDFIYNDADLWGGDEETWGNLMGADVTYLNVDPADWRDTYATNIAGYSETDDGYALRNVEDSAARIDYEVQAIDVDADTDLNDRQFTGTYHNGHDYVYSTRIQTSTSTQYYLVVRSQDNDTANGWTVDDVITWTGYNNVPDEAVLADNYNDVAAYAVTRATRTSDGDYYVADVVVFETLAADNYDTYFVYEENNWNTEYVWAIGYDEDGVIGHELQVNVDQRNINLAEVEFYEIDEDGNVAVIDTSADVRGEYEAKNIYAGTANTGRDLEDINYIQVTGTAAGDLYIDVDGENEDPIYYVYRDGRDGEYLVDTIDRDDVDNGDEIILFTDDDENVQYAINVTKSFRALSSDDDYATYEAWDALYDAILLDATEVLYATAAPDVSVGTVEGTGADGLTIELSYAQYLASVDANGNIPVTVEPAVGNSINIDGSSAWSNDTLTANVTIESDGSQAVSESFTVASKGTETNSTGVVRYYTVTVEVKEDNRGTDLASDGTTPPVAGGINNYDGPAEATISSLVGPDGLGNPEDNPFYTHNGASWEWHFYDGRGREYTEAEWIGTSVTDIDYATVVVTANNPDDSAEYVILFGDGTSTVTTDNVDGIVAFLLANRDEDAPLTDISSIVWEDNNAITDDYILPAMLRAGISPVEIFEDFTTDTKTAVILAEQMAGEVENVDAEDIVDAYVTYWFNSESPKGATGIDPDDDGEGNLYLYIVADGTVSLSDTDLVEVAEAAGLDVGDSEDGYDGITISWFRTDDADIGVEDGTVAQFQSNWDAIVANVQNGTTDGYTITVECNGMSYTVTLTLAEEE